MTFIDAIGYAWALALGMLTAAIVSERMARLEPTREELATLRRWGWGAPDEGGWVRDPASGEPRRWERALVIIARDEARGDRP